MSRPFYSDAKRPKMCRSSSSLSHFLFPCDFSGTITDRDIINTPLERLRPEMFLAATFLQTKSPSIHPTKVAAKKNIFLASL